jgi:hypothetical protein
MSDETLWDIKFWCIGTFAMILIPFVLTWFILITLPIRLGKRVHDNVKW